MAIEREQLVDGERYWVNGRDLAVYNESTETFDGGSLGSMSPSNAVSAERVWKVKADYMEVLANRFAKIGNRAKRLSVESPSFKVVFSLDEPEVKYNEVLQTAEKTGRVIRWNFVTLQGVTPMLAGWTFCGTLEHADEIGTVVRTVPGQVIPATYFKAEPGNCDHCHQIRRRVETFVVRQESGEYKQVGRQCIQDFLGGHDPKRALALVQMLSLASDILNAAADDNEGFFGGGMRRKEAFDTESILTTTMAVIRSFGWVSRSAVREGKTEGRATADRVSAFMTDVNDSMFKNKRGDVDEVEKAKYMATDDDANRAAAALEWARDLPESDLLKSEYLHNVHIMAKAGAIETKHFGIACSIAAAYNREQDREAQRKAERENDPVADCPEGRTTIAGTVVGMKEQYTDFGACLKITVKDDRGFSVYVTCPRDLEEGLRRGDRVTMTATLTRSDRDAAFGFGKRPSKASILERAEVK